LIYLPIIDNDKNNLRSIYIKYLRDASVPKNTTTKRTIMILPHNNNEQLFKAIDSLDKSSITTICSSSNNASSIINDQSNEKHETALHRAIRVKTTTKEAVKQLLEIIRVLMVWGANIRLIDIDGYMPVELAILNDELDIVMFLCHKEHLSLHYNAHTVDLNYLKQCLSTSLRVKNERITRYLKTLVSNYKVKAISDLEVVQNLNQLSKDEKQFAQNTCSQPLNIKNLSLQGGGVLGIGYLGALEEMESNGILLENIERVAGTSAGAICSCFIAVGYTVQELHDEMLKFNFENVLDEGDIKVQFLKIIEDIEKGNTGDLLWRLIILLKNFPDLMGLFPGKRFKEELERRIALKTGNGRITFGELHKLKVEKGCKYYKDLYVVAQDLCTSSSTVFSYEHSSDTVISDCIRASMSIPVLFHPIDLPAPGYDASEKHMFVDGGLGMNYPLTIFDKERYLHDGSESDTYIHNPESIGFRLVDKQLMMHYLENTQIKANPCPNGLVSFLSALYSQQGCAQEMLYQLADPHHDRTAFIDRLDISFIDFALKPEEIQNLIQAGVGAMKSYFERKKHSELKTSASDWVVVEDVPDDIETAVESLQQQEQKSCVVM
jgi:NTE family protein